MDINISEFWENKENEENNENGKKSVPELLLHPNLPKPLHGINPRTIMGAAWWDKERKAAYARHDYHCMACGIYAPWDFNKERFEGEQKLHAHESYEINYEEKFAKLTEIVALCPLCHDYIHSGRTHAMYGKEVYDEFDCWHIFTHGDSVLIDAGYSPGLKQVDTATYAIEWNEWYLLLNGKKHYSKFKSYDEWREHYSG